MDPGVSSRMPLARMVGFSRRKFPTLVEIETIKVAIWPHIKV